jgi:hypothetical protein
MYKSLIERLNEITDETGAKIVLSSAWRCETLEESQIEINDILTTILSLYTDLGFIP